MDTNVYNNAIRTGATTFFCLAQLKLRDNTLDQTCFALIQKQARVQNKLRKKILNTFATDRPTDLQK